MTISSFIRCHRHIFRGVAFALVGAFVALAFVQPAAAKSGDYGTVTGTEHRDCPDTRCASKRYIPANTRVPVWCWRDAGSANGTVRWFRVRYSGVDGWVSAARVTQQPTVPYCSDLRPGEALFRGQTIWSANGTYKLVMQGDGNLVLYWPSGAKWSTRTARCGTCSRPNFVIMQGDGNLVLYEGSKPGGPAKPWWATGTMGGGNSLAVQTDGNVVTYRSGAATWAASWHWIRGQTKASNTGAAGNCTWYAYDRFKKFSGVYPNLSGDAHVWNDRAQERGWLVRSGPSTQSVVVFERNVQGSGSVGHVAWVDAMEKRADGTYVHVAEMNYKGLGVISNRWVKHVPGMSYIMAPQL